MCYFATGLSFFSWTFPHPPVVYDTDAPAVGRLEHLWGIPVWTLVSSVPVCIRKWLEEGEGGSCRFWRLMQTLLNLCLCYSATVFKDFPLIVFISGTWSTDSISHSKISCPLTTHRCPLSKHYSCSSQLQLKKETRREDENKGKHVETKSKLNLNIILARLQTEISPANTPYLFQWRHYANCGGANTQGSRKKKSGLSCKKSWTWLKVIWQCAVLSGCGFCVCVCVAVFVWGLDILPHNGATN